MMISTSFFQMCLSLAMVRCCLADSDHAPLSVKTCEELNWDEGRGSDKVCAESEIPDVWESEIPDCFHLSFADASAKDK